MGRIRFGVVSAAFAFAALVMTEARASLIAHWDFEDLSSGSALDIQGGHHGLALGVTSVADATRNGNVLELNNIADVVRVPHSPDLVFEANQDSFSLSAWVRTHDSAPAPNLLAGTIIEKKTGSGSGYSLRIGGLDLPHVGFEGNGDSGLSDPHYTVPASTLNITDDEWHHIVGVHDATDQSLTLYIDGENVASRSTSGTSGTVGGTGTLEFGSSTTFGPTDWTELTGYLDDVKIFDHALSAAEVLAESEGVDPALTDSIAKLIEDDFNYAAFIYTAEFSASAAGSVMLGSIPGLSTLR